MRAHSSPMPTRASCANSTSRSRRSKRHSSQKLLAAAKGRRARRRQQGRSRRLERRGDSRAARRRRRRANFQANSSFRCRTRRSSRRCNRSPIARRGKSCSTIPGRAPKRATPTIRATRSPRWPSLRAQKAQLLGYPNYAAYVLEDQMAKTPRHGGEVHRPARSRPRRRKSGAKPEVIQADDRQATASISI